MSENVEKQVEFLEAKLKEAMFEKHVRLFDKEDFQEFAMREMDELRVVLNKRVKDMVDNSKKGSEQNDVR